MKRALVLSMTLALPLAACAEPRPIPMLNAPEAPAAQGTVITKVAENGNLRLVVQVKHLAPPEKMMPNATVYVVWVQPPGAGPQNVGALRVDSNLTGRLETTTAHPVFDVFITAEESPTAAFPRGPRVLTASVS